MNIFSFLILISIMINIDQCNPQKFFRSSIILQSLKASSDQRIAAVDYISPLGFRNKKVQFIAKKKNAVVAKASKKKRTASQLLWNVKKFSNTHTSAVEHIHCVNLSLLPNY